MSRQIDRLDALVPLLDPALAYELKRLLDAKRTVRQHRETLDNLQRAEDLVGELRRQYTARERQVDQLRAELKDLRAWHRLCPPLVRTRP